MVATKQNSMQMPEEFIEGEELCVAGVWCVHQESREGDGTNGRLRLMQIKENSLMNVLIA